MTTDKRFDPATYNPKFNRGRKLPALGGLGAMHVELVSVEPDEKSKMHYLVHLTTNGWPDTRRVIAKDELDAIRQVLGASRKEQ